MPARVPSCRRAVDATSLQNQLASEAEIVDARNVMALYYAETDVQRRLIDISTQSISMLEYDLAMWEQFGQGITPRKDGPLLAPNQKPGTLVADQRLDETELTDAPLELLVSRISRLELHAGVVGGGVDPPDLDLPNHHDEDSIGRGLFCFPASVESSITLWRKTVPSS